MNMLVRRGLQLLFRQWTIPRQLPACTSGRLRIRQTITPTEVATPRLRHSQNHRRYQAHYLRPQRTGPRMVMAHMEPHISLAIARRTPTLRLPFTLVITSPSPPLQATPEFKYPPIISTQMAVTRSQCSPIIPSQLSRIPMITNTTSPIYHRIEAGKWLSSRIVSH
jgi:hypothetical protein